MPMTGQAVRTDEGESLRFVAKVSGQTMVLDLQADRYYLATPARRRDGLRAAGRSASEESGAVEIADGRAPILHVPSNVIWADRRGRLVPAHTALRCLGQVSHALESQPFLSLVRLVADAPTRSGPPRISIPALLASFEAARPFFSKARICRLDAPALCLLLRRYGFPAKLVFGGRLEPFSAHCWAEVDGSVLNEPPATIRTYTPILAV